MPKVSLLLLLSIVISCAVKFSDDTICVKLNNVVSISIPERAKIMLLLIIIEGYSGGCAFLIPYTIAYDH